MQKLLTICMTTFNLSMCAVFNGAVRLREVMMVKELKGISHKGTSDLLCRCAVNLKLCLG